MEFYFSISPVKHKKYRVTFVDNYNYVDFGDDRYEHYKTSDEIPRSLHIYKEHNDPVRRERYLKRALGIRDKNGKLTYNNIYSPNYWSIRYLW